MIGPVSSHLARWFSKVEASVSAYPCFEVPVETSLVLRGARTVPSGPSVGFLHPIEAEIVDEAETSLRAGQSSVG